MSRPKPRLSLSTAAAAALAVLVGGFVGAFVGGCAPDAAGPLTQGKVAVVPPPSTQPITDARVGSRPHDHIVEIITKPVVIHTPMRGSTTRSSKTGNGMASRSTPAAPPTAAGPAPKLTLTDLQRVDTAITTAPLVRLLAMKLNHIPYQQFAGYGAVDFTPNLPEGTNPDTMSVDILARDPAGTAAAMRHLIGGKVDLVVAPRQPTPAEQAAAAAAGVKLRADFIATEALVFTVNTQNPVTGLSKDQLLNVFNGKFTTWKDLGPKTVPANTDLANQPITVAYRVRGTGSEELMEQVLLGGQKMPELPVSRALSSGKLVLDAAAEDPETIGFSVFCYITNMKPDARIRVLPVDGVMPEPANIASGSYPLTTPIYVISRSDLPSGDLYDLRAWLANMGGQRVLAEAGYMPMINEAWTSGRLK